MSYPLPGCTTRNGLRAVWYYVLVVLLSIAVPAQHEIAGAFLCVTLFVGAVVMRVKRLPAGQWYLSLGMAALSQAIVMVSPGNTIRAAQEHKHLWDIDRKSTRLNSSHVRISYAVFCLEKKRSRAPPRASRRHLQPSRPTGP